MSEPDVVVIGGGPAGLSAAIAAAGAGASVSLYDESQYPGGQLRYRRCSVRGAPDGSPEPAVVVAERLVAGAREAGVAMIPLAVVWSIFTDGSLAVSVSEKPRLVRPRAIVVATGSTDLPLPFPGASLPGVFSGRAVLIAIHAWRVLPGQRWALVGNGPEREEVAQAITRAGGAIVVRAEPQAGDTIEAAGPRGVERVAVNGRSSAVDCVAVAAGRQPDAAIATMAGCALGADRPGAPLAPVVDAFGRSSLPSLLVAGDAAGVCSPEVGMAEGRVVGLAAASRGGRADEARLDRALDRELPLLADRLAARRHRRELYAQPSS